MSSNRHHKKCRSNGGNTSNRNCVRVDAKRHYFWHALFGNMTGEEIAQEINKLWLDGDYKVVRR